MRSPITMTEEKLQQAYLRGRSYVIKSQAAKSYPDTDNPVAKFINEFTSSEVYRQEILPDLRKMAGYETWEESVPHGYPPTGNHQRLLEDLEESFAMGIEDSLRGRSILQQIDVR